MRPRVDGRRVRVCRRKTRKKRSNLRLHAYLSSPHDHPPYVVPNTTAGLNFASTSPAPHSYHASYLSTAYLPHGMDVLTHSTCFGGPLSSCAPPARSSYSWRLRESLIAERAASMRATTRREGRRLERRCRSTPHVGRGVARRAIGSRAGSAGQGAGQLLLLADRWLVERDHVNPRAVSMRVLGQGAAEGMQARLMQTRLMHPRTGFWALRHAALPSRRCGLSWALHERVLGRRVIIVLPALLPCLSERRLDG